MTGATANRRSLAPEFKEKCHEKVLLHSGFAVTLTVASVDAGRKTYSARSGMMDLPLNTTALRTRLAQSASVRT